MLMVHEIKRSRFNFVNQNFDPRFYRPIGGGYPLRKHITRKMSLDCLSANSWAGELA